MIENFIKKYGELSDSIVYEINFKLYNLKEIELILYCANIENSFIYETVKVLLKDVTELSFYENENYNNFSFKDVLIKNEEGIILFDFDPIDHFDYLEESQQSKFKIKFKNLEYMVIS